MTSSRDSLPSLPERLITHHEIECAANISFERYARWAERTFHPEDTLLVDVRTRSDAAGLPAIAVGTMDGLHLEVLARAIHRASKQNSGARRFA